MEKDLTQTNLTEKFSKRLKEAMEDKGFNQAVLSKLSKVDKGSISHYISGNYEPKTEKLCKLANALGVSASWLMGFNVPKYEDIYNESEFYISELEKDFITDYRKYFKVKQLGEPQREELMLDIELLKYFHCLNTNGKKSVIAAARGFCIESDYVNAERLQETLA